MSVKVTPEEFARKQARNLKNSTEDIRRGIERVTESPTEKAAAKADKMLANITESVTSGKWANNLRKVGLDTWKKLTLDKGVPRIAAGIDGAYDKVVNFAGELIPHIERGQAQLTNMPDTTLQDNIARMVKMTEHMATFKKGMS